MIDDKAGQKVFCIGFQKTGTTSLGKALSILGYSVEGYYPFRNLAKKGDLTFNDIWSIATDLLNTYDAFKDTPWPVLYKKLDSEFPDSKFILVKRDPEKWIQSVVEDFGSYPNEIHRLIYGTAFPLGNERNWIDRYNQHNNEVESYFSNNADRFVSLNLSKGECNWDSVCNFLSKPLPSIAWPHSNSKNEKRINMARWKIENKLQQVFGIDEK